MRSRGLAFFTVLLALAGCQALPGDGPWMNNASSTSTEVMPFDVIDLTTTTVVAYRAVPKPQPRSTAGPSPGHRITISPGDVLNVSIFERYEGGVFPTLQKPGANIGNRIVSDGGTIDVPFVGTVRVAGLELKQVEAELLSRLRRKVEEPQVVVGFASDRSNTYRVAGEVRQPGRQSLADGPLSVIGAINRAGGPTFPPSASTGASGGSSGSDGAAGAAGGLSSTVGAAGGGARSSSVRRTQPEPAQVVGGPTQLQVIVRRRGTVVLDALLSDLQVGGDIAVEKDDEIVVMPNSQFITVMGAVTRASNVPVTKGDMSLAEALGEASGLFDLRANKTGVFVFRMSDLHADSGARARIFRLDLMQPVSVFVAQEFAMKAQDVIYVTNAPLYEYEKFLSSIYRSLALWSVTRGTLTPALRF